MSFGEGNLHERVRQLESRNKALKADNERIRERVSAILGEMRDELLESCDYVGTSGQRKGDVLKAFGRHEAELREVGIEVDA